MADERFKVSGELFRGILAKMDSLTRAELMELRTERKDVKPEHCSPRSITWCSRLGILRAPNL